MEFKIKYLFNTIRQHLAGNLLTRHGRWSLISWDFVKASFRGRGDTDWADHELLKTLDFPAVTQHVDSNGRDQSPLISAQAQNGTLGA